MHTKRTILAIPLLAFAAACNGAHAESAPVAVETKVAVRTTTAARVDVPNFLALEGTLRAKRSSRLSPLVSGHVAKVEVERGDHVEAGAPLVSLRSADYRLAAKAASARAAAQLDQLGLASPTAALDPESTADVAAAKADWQQRIDQLRRLEPLAARGVVDEQSLDQARTSEAAAHARYEAARQRAVSSLSSYTALAAEASMRRNDATNTVLRAPFAGDVVERLADVGEYVTPTTPVVELVDASELRLSLEVPERFATSVREGQSVEIAVDGTDVVLEGTVRYVAAALDAERRTLTIEVVAPNADGRVRAGHFARARLRLDGSRSLVTVPSTALRERAGVRRVYVVVDGHADARIVDVVERRGATAVVSGDIPTDAAIVADPPRELADGSSVSVSPAGH